MFIGIKKFKGALTIENLLAQYKRGKAEITPEVCREVLEATNYPRNIRDMLECVAKLPIGKQANFKDVVLSTFEQREQPVEIWHLGRELATGGGYGEELGTPAQMEKTEFFLSAAGGAIGIKTTIADWRNQDLSIYEKMIFLTDKANLSNAVNLPENLEILGCDKVDLSGCDLVGVKRLRFKDGAKIIFRNAQNLPEDVDVSNCNDICFRQCNLAGINWLRFKEGAKVDFRSALNLPENLDVSMCNDIEFCQCNLAGINWLRFKDGAKVYFDSAVNLPEDLDVSMCDEVFFNDCNLAEIKKLRFKDRAEIILSNAKNLPADLDVSMCGAVYLEGCDLEKIKNLKFAKGARVYGNAATILPENVDLAECGEINLQECELRSVKCLKFKDRQQMKESEVKIPKDWDGKLVFADEQMPVAELLATKGKNGR